MRLTFAGAAGTVTGSRCLVEARGATVLVDCGLFQGLKAFAALSARAPTHSVAGRISGGWYARALAPRRNRRAEAAWTIRSPARSRRAVGVALRTCRLRRTAQLAARKPRRACRVFVTHGEPGPAARQTPCGAGGVTLSVGAQRFPSTAIAMSSHDETLLSNGGQPADALRSLQEHVPRGTRFALRRICAFARFEPSRG